MREPHWLDIVLAFGLLGAFLLVGLITADRWIRAETETEAVTLPPVEVTEPACEWGGPYPGFVEGTEMWIVICAKGEGDG